MIENKYLYLRDKRTRMDDDVTEMTDCNVTSSWVISFIHLASAAMRALVGAVGFSRNAPIIRKDYLKKNIINNNY